MREEGIVRREENGLCEVVVRRRTACGDNCASCGGACKMNFQTVTAKNPLGAKAGDCVIIEMDGKKVLLSAFLVYILPLFVFLISFYGTRGIGISGAASGSISAALTVAAFGITVIYDRRHKTDFLPEIIKIEENA